MIKIQETAGQKFVQKTVDCRIRKPVNNKRLNMFDIAETIFRANVQTNFNLDYGVHSSNIAMHLAMADCLVSTQE